MSIFSSSVEVLETLCRSFHVWCQEMRKLWRSWCSVRRLCRMQTAGAGSLCMRQRCNTRGAFWRSLMQVHEIYLPKPPPKNMFALFNNENSSFSISSGLRAVPYSKRGNSIVSRCCPRSPRECYIPAAERLWPWLQKRGWWLCIGCRCGTQCHF